MHTVIVTLAVIAIVAYVIGRQLLGEPLRGKRLIALPAILALVGSVDLGQNGRHPHAIDIVLIVIGGVIAAGIGLGQGRMMRLEPRAGVLWGKMPVKSLWLWGALILSHVALIVIARAAGAHVAASTAPVLLLLGINRLGQAGAVAPRAFAAGIPFAPEKDGSTFLGSVFGAASRTGGPAGTAAGPVPGTATRPPVPHGTVSPEQSPAGGAPPPVELQDVGGAPGRAADWAALGRELASSASPGGRRSDGRREWRQERRNRRR